MQAQLQGAFQHSYKEHSRHSGTHHLKVGVALVARPPPVVPMVRLCGLQLLAVHWRGREAGQAGLFEAMEGRGRLHPASQAHMHASLQRLLEGPLELHPPDPNTFTQLHNPGLLCSSPMAPGGSTHLTLSVRRSSGPSSPSSYATSCRPLALSKPTTCAQQGLPGSAQRLGVVCSGYNAELAARAKPQIAGCKAVSKWLAAHTVARGRYNAQQRGRCAPPQNRRPGRRASTRRRASPPQSAPPAAQALHRNKAGGMQKRRLVSCMQWQQLLLCNGSRKLLREHAWHATSTCSPWLLLTAQQPKPPGTTSLCSPLPRPG